MHRTTMSRRRGNVVVKVWQRFAFDGMTHNALQLADHVVVLRRDQRKRVPGALRASRAPDAVNVRVGGVWHVVVDHMRDAVNVETARGDIRGDHDGEVPSFETMQRLFALSLGAVAMQTCNAESGMGDLTGNCIGAVLGARKNQHRIAGDFLQKLD